MWRISSRAILSKATSSMSRSYTPKLGSIEAGASDPARRMTDKSEDIKAPHPHPDLLPSPQRAITSPGDELVPLPASLRSVDGDDAVEAGTQRPKRARRGDIIGNRYIVDGQIGRGGMGRVLRVRHQVLGKAFALKLIAGRKASDPTACERFYREAKLASSLLHDNICSIVDFGNDPMFGLFMVMELLEGVSIHDRLREEGPMSPKPACAVMWQVAEALRYIHGRSIVHGDIKSENILLIQTPHQRRVKLLDFGLARVNVQATYSTLEGTPEYMAPECVQGQAASPRSDIYALGILFYELLVGATPFRGGTLEEVLHKQLQEPLPRVSQILEDAIDSRADELVARATAKNPGDRHQDVAGFLYELQTLMSMLGMSGGRRRRHQDAASSGRGRRGPGAMRLVQGAAEVFEHAPIPLAAVDGSGKVKVANRAFLDFLGLTGDAAGIELGDSHLPEVYPELLDDLTYVASSRKFRKRVITLHDPSEGVVEVAVILSPVPSSATVTAGDVHMTLHPLGRVRRPG